jgi:Tol biopolymer transport system component
VAYTSDESGQDEVYVRSFSMNSAGTAVEAGGKWPISNGFGTGPRWRSDGRELYYRSRAGGLLAVEIAANPAFRAGNPQPLGVSTSASWDPAADGRRFLSLANKSGPQPYTVVLNWQAGLKK